MKEKIPEGTQLRVLDADPAKAFFVEMLTRDLSLEDAILDLLDNCVDGALRARQRRGQKDDDHFAGFRAEITIQRKRFAILDNCGGIPESKLSYAFKHGNPDGSRDGGLPTVGIYGIGMKRAIYKIGKEARVATKSDKLRCEVPFTRDWMRSNKWQLPIRWTNEKFKEDGTLVEVTELRDEVQQSFSTGLSEFEKRLRELIGEHYAYLIDRGFSVSINGNPVVGKPIDMLFETGRKAAGIRPYFWQIDQDGVHVFLAIGFYKPPPKKDEDNDGADGEDEEENWRSEHSGWTVLCNHRVVAYCDKSYLTGWGDKPIPRFHTQFNAIRGIVLFESDDASKLPTTTTKRGLNLDSSLYAEVKNVMKDGLRIFIDSTNKWKGETDESRKMLRADNLEKLGLDALRKKAQSLVKPSRAAAGGFISKPELPEPDRPDRPVWIRFARPKEDVKLVAEYLLGDEDAKPATVGEECFQQVFVKAKR